MSHPSIMLTYSTTEDHWNPNQTIELPLTNSTVKEAMEMAAANVIRIRIENVKIHTDAWTVSFFENGYDGAGNPMVRYEIDDPTNQFPIDAGLSMTKW